MASEALGALLEPLPPELCIGGVPETALVDFWQWAYSDVLSNGVRGVLGEYLVAKALGVTSRPRVEWDAADLRYEQWRIEVKTTSAHQAWPLAASSKPSAPGFDIRPRRGWDASTGITAAEPDRVAHCYVLCVYLGPETDPTSNTARRVAVLDAARWIFHVVPTAELALLGGQRRIGLRGVTAHWPGVAFNDLAAAVHDALTVNPAAS